MAEDIDTSSIKTSETSEQGSPIAGIQNHLGKQEFYGIPFSKMSPQEESQVFLKLK